MAKQTLTEQINELKALLAAHGIVQQEPGLPTGQTDYIAFGSDEHRQFLGLVLVKEGDNAEGYNTFISPYNSDNVYRLEDELGVVNLYPGVDPETAAILMLRMKINELEGGAPEVPENAPSLWQPVSQNMTLLRQGV